MGDSFQTFGERVGGPAAGLVQLGVAPKGLFTAGVAFRCRPLPILETITGNPLVPACILKLVECLCEQPGWGCGAGSSREAQRSAPRGRITDVVSPVDAIAAASAAEPGQAVLWVAWKPALAPGPVAPPPLATQVSTSALAGGQLLEVGRFLAVPGGTLPLLAVVPKLRLPGSGMVPVLPVPRSVLLNVPGEPARLVLPGAVQLVALFRLLQPLLEFLFSSAICFLLRQLRSSGFLLLSEITTVNENCFWSGCSRGVKTGTRCHDDPRNGNDVQTCVSLHFKVRFMGGKMPVNGRMCWCFLSICY